MLRIGEIAIPVGLVATARDPDEKLFRTLHAGQCATPIRLAVVCPNHEPAMILEQDETVKAAEIAPGQFLPLTPEEVAALQPQDSSLIPIAGFVPVDDVDPLLVKKRYHLAPTNAFVGRRAYRALAAALDDNQVAAVARFNAWNSEQLAAITSRAGDADVLELATLHFAEDVALEQADAIAGALADTELGDLETDLMRELVARHTRTLHPDDLASVNRPRVRGLLERKLAGQPLVEPATDEPAAELVPLADLETALRASIKKAPRRRRATTRA